MTKETKSKIYKATVRPIMAYALETRVETYFSFPCVFVN